MAKNQFADKTAKAASKKKICPVCNSEITPIKLINAYKDDRSGGVKFGERFHKVCKCNEKEVFA
ncbi:MAG: hypothetical protein HUU10_07640 [Bacteroidetes bacterium]|nr:hypothetical protein [Bacteroidota bacterium]